MSITTASFDAEIFQDEVSAFVLNELVAGSVFAASLSPIVTDRGGVVIPRLAPAGFAWAAEGITLPTVTLNDSSDVTPVTKLAGTFDLSNESIADTALDIGNLIGRAVQDSMSFDLDRGLLYGEEGLEPNGVVARATPGNSSGSLREGVIRAWASLVDSGAPADRVVAFATAGTLAEELSRETIEGLPVHPDGEVPRLGSVMLKMTPAMEPGEILVVDTSHVYTVIRQDFSVEMDRSAGFRSDSTACRIVGRFAVAAPVPSKSLRLLTYEVPGS